MEHHVRLHAAGVGALLALAVVVSIVTSTVVAARAYEARGRQATQGSREIGVKGYARRRIRADLGVWSVALRGEAKTLPEAYADLEAGVTRVGAYLAAAGFPAESVSLSAIETTTHHARDREGRELPAVAGYVLERGFTVRSADVDRFARAASEVTSLLQEGVKVSSQRPEYTCSKIGDWKIELLGEASNDARARADQIATRSGCRVAGVRNAHMGVLQITRPDSTDVSSYGTYDTTTIDKDLSVVVTVTFGIDA